MTGKVDLHMHTTYSDGFYTPAEILNKAKENGFDAISITDHDSISGIEEATKIGKDIGIEVISGISFTTLPYISTISNLKSDCQLPTANCQLSTVN